MNNVQCTDEVGSRLRNPVRYFYVLKILYLEQKHFEI